MATEEDIENKTDEESEESNDESSTSEDASIVVVEKSESLSDSENEPALEDAPMPTQLGYKRYVYAAYLAGGIGVAFLANKLIDYAWFKLHDYKPATIGEPQDEISVVLATIIAIAVTLYYWNRTRARPLAEEVAEELTKVTWPSREEVTNSTTVVVFTTLLATVFFALMDQFWLWVTKHVYGS